MDPVENTYSSGFLGLNIPIRIQDRKIAFARLAFDTVGTEGESFLDKECTVFFSLTFPPSTSENSASSASIR